MARRFSAEHSPDGNPDPATADPAQPAAPNRFRGRKVANPRLRARLMFLLPLPLVFAGIGEMRAQQPGGMLAEFGAFVLLIAAAWLLRDGLKAEAAYQARAIARPPAIPRKMFATALTCLGVFIAAAFGMGAGVIAGAAYAAIASVAHLFSFGIDPLRRKGMEGLSDYETERVAKAVDKAEALLSEMLSAASRINDRPIQARVETLAAAVREMFRAVEDDPRDLSGARKFLGVYLRGARDATIKFADLYGKTGDTTAKAQYESLLTDLEASFNAQRVTMMQDNRTDLDVEIEVLRDRLKQEGLKAN